VLTTHCTYLQEFLAEYGMQSKNVAYVPCFTCYRCPFHNLLLNRQYLLQLFVQFSAITFAVILTVILYSDLKLMWLVVWQVYIDMCTT